MSLGAQIAILKDVHKSLMALARDSQEVSDYSIALGATVMAENIRKAIALARLAE